MKGNINKIQWLKYLGILVLGLFLGRLFFGGSSDSDHSEHQHATENAESAESVWTCSMHPQIKLPEPGDCPICGMDLIPLGANDDDSPIRLEMTEQAVKLGNVQTSQITREASVKEILLNGKVQIDERRIKTQTAHFGGRIERLYVNYTGETVRRGQRLAEIYSPQLVSAQKELFEALKFKELNPKLVESVREKLKLWKLTDAQIEEIENTGEVRTEITIKADVSGVVQKLNVALGDHVKEGEPVLEVVDLHRVWVVFDVYESDLSFVKMGDKLQFAVASYPGKNFEATVTFIDPFIDPQTRIAKVRTEISNAKGLLKPEMFATATVKAGSANSGSALTVPKSSIMWTGTRSVTYVEVQDTQVPTFEMRQVTLGASLGDRYIVEEGLEDGDYVVTNGAFTIDAAAQLNNKASMMNQEVYVKGKSSGEAEKVEVPSYLDKSPKAFQQQLQEVTKHYLKLKDALIASDQKTSQILAKEVLNSLEKVDMKLLKDQEAHMYWMDLLKVIKKQTGKIADTKQLEEQRKNFISLSQHLRYAIKAFGSTQKVFVQYCPMANDNKGASWLSLEEKVLNPYFGDAMLTCGEVEEEIVASH
ncbi:efflux RND transporter periplasmic adaptor subunit [Rapidithrix thailandica]|uniref:Efflux RND transporter periplasmic adaptor subunit n=1 Tax=Rapidithrix thailandica TaxID=413964 RepID=A0AAW9S0G6_9BACT